MERHYPYFKRWRPLINFINNNNETPYIKFREFYDKAFLKNQKSIEALTMSSYYPSKNEVDSRFVNLKIIDDKEFIFFTNYNSPKSRQFNEHNQISAIIFWEKINIQIRMKAKIKKKSASYNKSYFLKRSIKKNALAISSNQSEIIDSYEMVEQNYEKSLESDNLKKCPEYWGGYSFIPYYFEFWEGHESRLNKREVYEKSDDSWKHLILQP